MEPHRAAVSCVTSLPHLLNVHGSTNGGLGLATFYGIDSTSRLSYEALYWKRLSPQENNLRCQTHTHSETVSMEVFLRKREGAVTDEGLSWAELGEVH